MSDLLKGVQKSFDKSSKSLDKLSEDLNRLADLEAELGEISGSINLAASNLRQLSRDHNKFLNGAADTNDYLKLLADELGRFKPEQINKRLREINNLINELQDKTSSIQVALDDDLTEIKSSNSITLKILLVMFVCQALGFLVIAYKLFA